MTVDRFPEIFHSWYLLTYIIRYASKGGVNKTRTSPGQRLKSRDQEFGVLVRLLLSGWSILCNRNRLRVVSHFCRILSSIQAAFLSLFHYRHNSASCPSPDEKPKCGNPNKGGGGGEEHYNHCRVLYFSVAAFVDVNDLIRRGRGVWWERRNRWPWRGWRGWRRRRRRWW